MTDAACERVFLAIREPSMILVARLPDLRDVEHWKCPLEGDSDRQLLVFAHDRSDMFAA